MDATKIEVNLSLDKTSVINDVFQKELKYWKDAALKMPLDEGETNQIKDSAPPSFLLIRKPAKNAKKTDIDVIISYLKPQ